VKERQKNRGSLNRGRGTPGQENRTGTMAPVRRIRKGKSANRGGDGTDGEPTLRPGRLGIGSDGEEKEGRRKKKTGIGGKRAFKILALSNKQKTN